MLEILRECLILKNLSLMTLYDSINDFFRPALRVVSALAEQGFTPRWSSCSGNLFAAPPQLSRYFLDNS